MASPRIFDEVVRNGAWLGYLAAGRLAFHIRWLVCRGACGDTGAARGNRIDAPACGGPAANTRHHAGADEDRKSTRLNSSHSCAARMPSSASKQQSTHIRTHL